MAQVQHPTGSLSTGSIADDLATRTGEMQIVVVSPARPVYEGTARFLTVEALEGQLGVWPRHADLVAALGVGPMKIGHTDGTIEKFAVRGGFLKVTGGNKITVLVDRAVRADEVDAAEARRELQETLAALRHPGDADEFHELLQRRAWGQTQLHLAS